MLDSPDVIEYKQDAKVSCTSNADCAAAGLETWKNDDETTGGFGCPGMGAATVYPIYCSSKHVGGVLGKGGRLTVVGNQTKTPGPLLEQHVYSMNYSAKNPKIDKNELGTLHYVNAEGQAKLGEGTRLVYT